MPVKHGPPSNGSNTEIDRACVEQGCTEPFYGGSNMCEEHLVTNRKEYDLSREMKVMGALSSLNPMSAMDIAERTGECLSDIAQTLDRLYLSSKIQRKPGYPHLYRVNREET